MCSIELNRSTSADIEKAISCFEEEKEKKNMAFPTILNF